MTTRGWLLGAVAILSACSAPAEPGGAADPAGAALSPARPADPFAAPQRWARHDAMDRAAALPAPIQRTALAPAPDADCLKACGGAQWCDALCRLTDFVGDPAEPVSARADADCPQCGRETGFLPLPPTVEAVREGSGVIVRWSAVADASEYEVAVLRRKTARDALDRWADYTVEGTELRLSVLTAGFEYVFAVTPYLDGQLDPELTGLSAPLGL